MAPDTDDYASMPRKQLKGLQEDARRRLDRELRMYCDRNFDGMTVEALERLFGVIQGNRGLEMPRSAFESKFARFRPPVVRGVPMHATVVISLWGLKFWVPEAELAADLSLAIKDADLAMRALDPHYESEHAAQKEKRGEIREHLRRRFYASRSGVLSAFNLVECYMNSLAWEFLRLRGADALSNRQRKSLEDVSGTKLRDKLLKYPRFITGAELDPESRAAVEGLLDVLKPFRDSLVHPSPFDAPEKFGGYDKLRNLYRIDADTLYLVAHLAADIITRVQAHVGETILVGTPWLPELLDALKRHQISIPPEWGYGRTR